MLPDLDEWIVFYAFLNRPIIREGGLTKDILIQADALNGDVLEVLADFDRLYSEHRAAEMERKRVKAQKGRGHGRQR